MIVPVHEPSESESSTKWKEELQEKKERELQVATLIAAVKAAAAAGNGVNAKPESSTAITEDGGARKGSKSPKKHQSKEEKEKNKEKRLLKLVGAVVVKYMSKYQKDMDHDVFKKHAKEVCFAFPLRLLGVDLSTDVLHFLVDATDFRKGKEVIQL